MASFTNSFTFTHRSRSWPTAKIATRSASASASATTSLNMALTPIGPFCPFRSQAALEIEPRMESLNGATPEFATEMARLQLDMQVGQMPDPDRLRRVAEGIEAAVDDWENLLTRLKLSNDFQTREYAKLTQAHLASHGQNAEEIATMMRWQSQCMLALADNRPPPFPPAGVDVMKMMEQAKENAALGKEAPSMTQMAAAEKITSTPFTGEEAAFESENVREEYEALCRDHNGLIELGASYATFDPMGKLAYLDQVDSIEERWDVFFARFSLLGQLNGEFVKQCNAFLDSMGLDETGFRQLLRDTHDIMRKDAERERGLVA
eukprot:CAMPEP_0203646578 /NCGR_PEP_ID=MMETSP0088-20131115/13210_1 /ASSEMBLY_ACC=CAM_ASM_001087 /TAXON_ID=426623 /ORGANISM="Chaetoceros affinis, Strain CCMP159" /LENGTH=320 /DNA_ID=CAMNT_0050503829 /DNA_START=36 /DNA_END=998 /DNA_ORIENTATION=-